MPAPAYSSLLFDVIGSCSLVGTVELNTLNQFQQEPSKAGENFSPLKMSKWKLGILAN